MLSLYLSLSHCHWLYNQSKQWLPLIVQPEQAVRSICLVFDKLVLLTPSQPILVFKNNFIDCVICFANKLVHISSILNLLISYQTTAILCPDNTSRSICTHEDNCRCWGCNTWSSFSYHSYTSFFSMTVKLPWKLAGNE